MERAGATMDEIDSIGITNQRETVVVWDKVSGLPVCNAIVWQDRRTAEFCNLLKEQGQEQNIHSKTGLILDAYFSASKIKWILDNVAGAREKAESGQLVAGTIDTYLMWYLSGGKIFATDYTNASRTMLFNIHNLSYDEELLELFDIPFAMLPKVFPSSHCFGETDEKFFGGVIPVCGVAGDQQAALFGHLGVEKGSVKNTYGTGCFLLMNTGEDCADSRRGLITTLCASGGNRPHYALEGSVFIGGAAVQWLRDEMGLIKNTAESEELAQKVDSTGGVYFVPALSGLGAPHWDAAARGLITGITRGTNRNHIVRATLEAIAFQVFEILHAMERDTDITISSLSVDGGACANNFLMQFQSDICNAQIVRRKDLEPTALGTAFLAGLKTGFYKSIEELRKIAKIDKIFAPVIEEDKREELLLGWGEAILRAKAK
ncbi:sugar kinase [Holotrichia oblita]|nr:sugar kinase [Holotrichia oblita]